MFPMLLECGSSSPPSNRAIAADRRTDEGHWQLDINPLQAVVGCNESCGMRYEEVCERCRQPVAPQRYCSGTQIET